MAPPIKFYLLHENVSLIDGACELLQSHWPRNRSSRERTLLTPPRPSLPASVVMTLDDEVIGHYRLSESLENETWSIVESVIIARNKRGQGFGAVLMRHCMNMATNTGKVRLYLSTHDQSKFYSKLGFQPSCAVSILTKVNKIFRGRNFEMPPAIVKSGDIMWMCKDLVEGVSKVPMDLVEKGEVKVQKLGRKGSNVARRNQVKLW